MQKIICLNQHGFMNDSGGGWGKLQELLDDEWIIKEMQTVSNNEEACCFVWLEKQNEDKPSK